MIYLLTHSMCPFCMRAREINSELGHPFSELYLERPTPEVSYFNSNAQIVSVFERDSFSLPALIYKSNGKWIIVSIPRDPNKMRGFMEYYMKVERGEIDLLEEGEEYGE